ncbi:MAG: peptidoglycan DD-metalloendopeptidase family protein [Clostridiales Family XIII bacterium]|jgi:murein DD-endopeptidase MepM/ murein hydrolase activator NlpD|nr:peptidoglycan DD-metalloendopeptidase family protein [Clostridiales Family XIII bacterium]
MDRIKSRQSNFSRLIARILTVCLLFLATAFTVAFAVEQDDLDRVRKEISETQAKYSEGKKKENALSSRIKELEAKIKATEREISVIQSDINETQQAIRGVEQSLAEAEAEIAVQNDDLNKRLRAMYMNGEMGMLDIILSSANISEFMSATEMVQKIYESDIHLLEEMEVRRAGIDAQKKELERLRQNLVANQTARIEKQREITADKQEAALAKVEVSDENERLSQMLDELNEEANRITAEILKKMGSQDFIGGAMGWPVPGYSKTSSPFGIRNHPTLKVPKMHTGIDIPCPKGTPIVASNGGTVIMATWNNSYGNVIMVDHGGKIVTLYAHNSSFAVSEGAVVARGQTIAYAGSTGNSTGPHCHFEVRVNGEYQNPLQWVSP